MLNNLFLRLVPLVMVAASGAVLAQNGPMPIPSAAPVATQMAKPEADKPLKFRDPSTPLSIGEMSALQAEKLESDFYKKLGYTVTAPIAGPSAAEVNRQKVASKPLGNVSALAIYGPASALAADIIVNGQLVSVRGGETFAGGVTVTGVQPGGVQITIPSRKKRSTMLSYSLAVGGMLEFPL